MEREERGNVTRSGSAPSSSSSTLGQRQISFGDEQQQQQQQQRRRRHGLASPTSRLSVDDSTHHGRPRDEYAHELGCVGSRRSCGVLCLDQVSRMDGWSVSILLVFECFSAFSLSLLFLFSPFAGQNKRRKQQFSGGHRYGF